MEGRLRRSKSTRGDRILSTLRCGVVISLALFSFALPAAADHPPKGEAEVVLVGPLGPYNGIISVAPAPPLQTGRNSVGVTLQEPPPYFEYVVDAEVTITAEPPSGGPPQTQQALHENAIDKRDYAAYFEMDEPGEWTITVKVSGEEGQGEAGLKVNVEPRRYTLLIIAVVALIAAIVAFVIWGRDPLPSGDDDDDTPKEP